jgi:hypothetical protein
MLAPRTVVSNAIVVRLRGSCCSRQHMIQAGLGSAPSCSIAPAMAA